MFHIAFQIKKFLVKNASRPVSWNYFVPALLTAVPEEVIELRRCHLAAGFSDLLPDKLHGVNGTCPYFHLGGGTCRDEFPGIDLCYQ